jgi:HupE / UreJ protein
LFVSGGSAQAHSGGTTGFAAVTVDGQTVRYSLSLTLEAVEGARTNPLPAGQVRLSADYEALAAMVARHITISADGNPCVPLPGIVQPPAPERSSVVIVIHYACAAPARVLLLRDDLFVALGRDHHTIAKVEWPGGYQQVMFDPDRTEARLSLVGDAPGAPAASAAVTGALGFFWLGLEHILAGFDHILFLFALMLRGGSIGSLLGIVTAFTLAHSITLGLATLDVVRPPAQLVEPLIALSIAYVAVENIFAKHAPSRRWLASLLFGFVHGFGFAGALLELGLPDTMLFSSLLFFNLGVEAGQAMIVALLFPVLLWLSRFPGERRAVTVISAVVLTAALALLAERVLRG